MQAARVIWTIALLFAAPPGFAAEESEREIGWVLEYSPADAIHKIHRQNISAPVAVKLGTPLHAGDVITVEKNGRVLVGLADGSERAITGGGSWSVPETSPRPALWRVMQSMFGLIEREGSMASSAVAKGGSCVFSRESDPLEVPILSTPQKVAAGSQALSFAWSGGCPPYALAIESRGRTVAKVSSVQAHVASFPETSLRAGAYSLRIRESRGRELRSKFDVVTSVPQPPADLASASSKIGALTHAVWLADQEGGAWRLESVRRLQPLVVEQQPMAEKIRDVFLWSRPATH